MRERLALVTGLVVELAHIEVSDLVLRGEPQHAQEPLACSLAAAGVVVVDRQVLERRVESGIDRQRLTKARVARVLPAGARQREAEQVQHFRLAWRLPR
jgi:hypothetical protein